MDEDWVYPAFVFVSAQYVIALTISGALGFPHIPPMIGYLTIGAVVTVAGAVCLLVRALWQLWRAGVLHPAPQLWKLMRENKSRLLVAAVGIQLVVLQVGSLTWLKTLMPLIVPFWADPYLAALDDRIFRTDPWKLLTWLKPAEPLIDTVYALWFPIKSYTMAAVLLSLPSFNKSRSALAYFYTIGLFGVAGQYAFSSAGPLFYQVAGFGNHFADLEQHLTPIVKAARSYLWNTYRTGGDSIGSGISAMPSVHVALAAWVALTVRSVFKPLAILGWAFLAIIFVGSIYLGWHYATDGIVGIAAALLSWKLAGVTVRKFETLRQQSAFAEAD